VSAIRRTPLQLALAALFASAKRDARTCDAFLAAEHCPAEPCWRGTRRVNALPFDAWLEAETETAALRRIAMLHLFEREEIAAFASAKLDARFPNTKGGAQ